MDHDITTLISYNISFIYNLNYTYKIHKMEEKYEYAHTNDILLRNNI